jgi:hypothetical protein
MTADAQKTRRPFPVSLVVISSFIVRSGKRPASLAREAADDRIESRCRRSPLRGASGRNTIECIRREAPA